MSIECAPQIDYEDAFDGIPGEESHLGEADSTQVPRPEQLGRKIWVTEEKALTVLPEEYAALSPEAKLVIATHGERMRSGFENAGQLREHIEQTVGLERDLTGPFIRAAIAEKLIEPVRGEYRHRPTDEGTGMALSELMAVRGAGSIIVRKVTEEA